MTELAVGYVSVVAETRGLGAEIDKAMRGVQSRGGQYGRGLGSEVKKGFESASPIDLKQVEQAFNDSEKRRAAVVARTTEAVTDARRKEEIASAKLAETEKKYAADSSQVLVAKDRLVTASKKVQIEEAKQSVAVERASKDVASAKTSLEDLSRAKDDTAGKAKGFGVKIGDSFRGIGRDAGDMGREVGQSFAKIGQGDFRGAFSGLKSAFGITKREGKSAGIETGQSFSRGLGAEVRDGSKQMATWLKLGLVGVAAKLGVDFGSQFKSALSGASDLEQSVGGMQAIFKKDFAEMDKAAQGAAQTLGLSRNAYNELATTVGAGLNNKGIKDYAGSTKDLLGLGADLAAQFGGSTEEAVQAISSLMRGESDPIERYGVAINETAISAELAARGQSKLTGAALETAKAQARMDILFKQTAAAQGTFARESDTMAGKQQRATAAFEDFKTALGTRVLPVATLFFGFLNDKAIPGLDRGLGVIDKAIAGVKGIADVMVTGDFKGGIFGLEEDSPIIGVLFGIRDAIGKTVAVAKAMFTGDFKGGAPFGIEEDSPIIGVVFGIRDAIKGAFGAAKDAVKGFVDGFGGMDSITAKVGPVLSMLAGPLGLLKTALFDLVKGLDFEQVGSSFGSAVRPIVDSVVQLYGVVSAAAITLASGLVPVVSNIASTLMPILADVLARIVPVFSSLVSAVAPLVSQLVAKLAPALYGIVAAVLPVVATLAEALGPIISNIAAKVLPPLASALSTLAGIISTVVVPVLAAILIPVITQAGRLIGTVFGFIAETVENVMNFIAGVIKVVTSAIKGDWSGAWDGIKQIASAIWDQIKNIVDLGINLVKDTLVNTMGTITGDWDATWEDVKSIGSKAWEWIKDTAVGAFESMVTAIGNVWDGIKRIVGTPINAVIRFINDGIVGAYNAVADFLGIGKMGTISPLDLGGARQAGRGVARPMTAFQSGGYVDLPWSASNRDPYFGISPKGPLRFEGEEFIVNRAQTKKHRGILEDINSGRFMPDVHRNGGIVAPRFAGGGLVSYKGRSSFTPRFADVLAAANSIAPFSITKGGWKPPGGPSGRSHMGDAVDVATVSSAVVRALRSVGVAAWDRTGKGNWRPHVHGVPLPGYGTGRGSAPWQAQDYMRGGDGLGGRDNGPRIGAGSVIGGGMFADAEDAGSIWAVIGGKIAEGFKTVTDWISGAMEKVTAPLKGLAGEAGRSPFGKLILGVGDKLKSDLAGWVTGKASDDAEPVDKIKRGYANGTRSALPGLAMINEGRPEIVDFQGGERVYSGGDSARMMAGGTGGDVYHIHANVKDWADLAEFLEHVRNSDLATLQLDPAYA